MSSHGRSHHSLCATQGARIRVSASSRPYQTVCAAIQGGNVRHRRTTGGRVQKRPAIVRHGRSHHSLHVAQGARIRVDVSTHPYSVPRVSRTPALRNHLHAQVAQSKQARDTKKPTTSFTWPVAPLARRYPRCPDKGKRIIASIFSCSRRTGVPFVILSAHSAGTRQGFSVAGMHWNIAFSCQPSVS